MQELLLWGVTVPAKSHCNLFLQTYNKGGCAVFLDTLSQHSTAREPTQLSLYLNCALVVDVSFFAKCLADTENN